MKFGLTEEHLNFLEKHLITPLKEKKAIVYIFGSRANGKYKKFSDIDLLYRPSNTSDIDDAFIYSLISFFEESSFPYKIDLVKESALANSYKDTILKERIEL